MRSAIKMDIPGKVLLGIGAALALFGFTAALLMIRHGEPFLGMVKTGLWMLAAYAVIGGTIALALTIRRGRTNRHRSA